MATKKKLFNILKNEIFLLWSQDKNLKKFVNLPKNLIYNSLPKKKYRSVEIFERWKENENSIKSIHKLIRKVSPYANWRQTYKEKDVGKKFLKKFAYFELFGPRGHFLTNVMSLYVIFFDKNAYYIWHKHEAEELYYVISGNAKFESLNSKTKILFKSQFRYHHSYQPHSLTTSKDMCLCIVLWKDKLESELIIKKNRF